MKRKAFKLKAVSLFFTVIVLLQSVISAAASSDPFAEMLTYEEGQYKVGKDMIAGEYVLLSTTDFPGYFAVSTDANGRATVSNDFSM